MPFLTESGTRSSSPACAIIASKPARKQSQSRWWEITVPNISSPCVRKLVDADDVLHIIAQLSPCVCIEQVDHASVLKSERIRSANLYQIGRASCRERV